MAKYKWRNVRVLGGLVAEWKCMKWKQNRGDKTVTMGLPKYAVTGDARPS